MCFDQDFVYKMRAHANAAEHIPIFIILLGLMEYNEVCINQRCSSHADGTGHRVALFLLLCLAQSDASKLMLLIMCI